MTKLYSYHRVQGTISVILATSTTVTSAGGWRTDSGKARDATDGILDISEAGWGGLAFPSTFDGTEITFTAATKRDGTYYAVEDETGTALKMTVSAASKFVPFPARLFACGPFIKIVCSTVQATTDTVFPFVLTT